MNAKTTKASRNLGLNDAFKELLSGVVLNNEVVDVFKLQLKKCSLICIRVQMIN